MLLKDDELHDYPNHFYNPYKISDSHACEEMNLNSPSESYNNITVGAIADNFDGETDLTFDKNHPAYYTKKYFLDYSLKINGVVPYQSIMNNSLFKPDLVDFGGDVVSVESGIEVLSGNDTNFLEKRAGTSFATPLVTSIAAEIIYLYPGINTQSIKALLINSAKVTHSNAFLTELINSLKKEGAIEFFGKPFEELINKERLKLGKIFNVDRLSNYLSGFGKPNKQLCLGNSPNSATYIIEQSIKTNQHRVMVLNLPDYLQGLTENNVAQVLKVTASLVYKFEPVFNNQLSYCPLHISFGLFATMSEDLSELSEYITKSNPQLELLNLKKEFKSGIKWSEDFYPPNVKPFNNSQRISVNFRKVDLQKINNKLTIAVRATYKDGIDAEQLLRLKAEDHSFSIALRIEEVPIGGELSNNLYNSIHAINTIESIIEINTDLDIDLD
jgi:hypothetical protein